MVLFFHLNSYLCDAVREQRYKVSGLEVRSLVSGSGTVLCLYIYTAHTNPVVYPYDNSPASISYTIGFGGVRRGSGGQPICQLPGPGSGPGGRMLLNIIPHEGLSCYMCCYSSMQFELADHNSGQQPMPVIFQHF